MAPPGSKLSFYSPNQPNIYTSPAATGGKGNAGNPGKNGAQGLEGPQGTFYHSRHAQQGH